MATWFSMFTSVMELFNDKYLPVWSLSKTTPLAKREIPTKVRTMVNSVFWIMAGGIGVEGNLQRISKNPSDSAQEHPYFYAQGLRFKELLKT